MDKEKKEIINGLRNENVGSVFAAILMFSDHIKFYEYSLVADHQRGTVEFKVDDYKVVGQNPFLDSAMDEIMAIMETEKEKQRI